MSRHRQLGTTPQASKTRFGRNYSQRTVIREYTPSGQLKAKRMTIASAQAYLALISMSKEPKFNTPVKELKDMTAEERAAIEARYGAKIG